MFHDTLFSLCEHKRKNIGVRFIFVKQKNINGAHNRFKAAISLTLKTLFWYHHSGINNDFPKEFFFNRKSSFDNRRNGGTGHEYLSYAAREAGS